MAIAEESEHESADLPHEENPTQSRLQRLTSHRYFKPAVAVVIGLGATAATVISFAVRSDPDGSDDATDMGDTSGDNVAPHPNDPRSSPIQHTVNGYSRRQHYGAGNAEERLVNIEPHSRGRHSADTVG